MIMRLLTLDIRNFKGIKVFTLGIDGADATVSGANATGKTTLYDAFLWLLFGKDSAGSANFGAKPIAGGEEIHNLSTSVRALVDVDGARHELVRTLEENWVKPRGRAEATFQGNVSSYEIDGVPRKASEFAAFCAGLADESTFRLITNPDAFNNLRWQDRRAELLKLSGAPDMINDAKYDPIMGKLRAMGPDDLRKALQAQRRKLNAELDQIPARVDEVMAFMPSVTDDQARQADFIVSDAEHDIDVVRAMISDASGSMDRARSELEDLDRRVRLIDERNRAGVDRLRREREREESEHTRLISEAEQSLAKVRDRRARAQSDADAADAECAKMREKWKLIKAKEFTASDCPTCGQSLPEESINRAKIEWENDQRNKLDGITADGKRLAAMRDRMHAEAENCTVEESRLIARIESLKVTVEGMPYEQEAIPPETKERIEKLRDICAQPEDKRTADLRERLAELMVLRDKHKAVSAQYEARNAAQRRIDELTARQQELGRLVADSDLHIMLVEDYVADMCKRVEQNVERMFPTVRWKLYDRQINGGIADTCVCMIGGVPYSDANNAAKINAGLEIINVISDHIGVSVPIFIDNAESINQIIPTRGQQIQLVVTNDTALMVAKKEDK